MPNPVTIEKKFRELIETLHRVDSIRHRTWLMYRFISALEGEFNKYDSYLLQLAPELPRFTESLTYSGLDPAELERWADLFGTAERDVSALKTYQSFRENLKRLRQVVILQYGLTGDFEACFRNLEKQIRTVSRQGQEFSFPKFGEHHRMDFDGFLVWVTTSMRNLPKTAHDFIFEIQNEYRLISRQKKQSCLVPVVEQYNEGNFNQKYGRLRLMWVDVEGEAEAEKDQFFRQFDTVGVEQSQWDIPEKIIQSARRVSENINPGVKGRFFRGKIHYRLSSAVQAGSSSDAACTALLTASVLQKTSKRDWMELEPGICITGNINTTTEILGVAEEGIAQKVEAAFFSWVDVLAVPMRQLPLFIKARDELERKYPNRKLTITGISTLQDLFYDRRISKQVKISNTKYVAQKAWDNRFSVAGSVILMVLLAVIIWLFLGPLDSNPVYAEFRGTNMVFKNQYGASIKEVRLNNDLIDYIKDNSESSPRVDFFDLTGDGMNEVFWAERSSGNAGEKGLIKAWSVTGDSLIWNREMSFNFDFPRQQGLDSLYFQVDQFHLTQTGNGQVKIIVSAESGISFPSVISRMDAATGTIEHTYLHTGKIRDIELIDLNNNGRQEVVIAGINNAFWRGAVAVLDINRLEGHSPTEGDYYPSGMERANELAYILIPKTVVGKVFDPVHKYSEAYRIRHRQALGQFVIDVREVPPLEFRDHEYLPYTLFYFDYDLNPVSIVTSDLYDIMMRDLHQNGHLPYVPDYDYFEAFQDSLIWVE